MQAGIAENTKQTFHPVLLLVADGCQRYTFVRNTTRRIENTFPFLVVINTKNGDQFKLIVQFYVQVEVAQKTVERIFGIGEACNNGRIGVAEEIHLFVFRRTAIVLIVHKSCRKGSLHQCRINRIQIPGVTLVGEVFHSIHKAHVSKNLYGRIELNSGIDTGIKTIEIRTLYHRFLIHKAQRQTIDGYLITSGNIERIMLLIGRPENLILPVGVFVVPVIIHIARIAPGLLYRNLLIDKRQGLYLCRRVLAGALIHIDQVMPGVFGVQHGNFRGLQTQSLHRHQVDFGSQIGSAFGLNQQRTVGSLHSVNRAGILYQGDTVDILHINSPQRRGNITLYKGTAELRIFEHHAVDNEQRLVGSIQGIETPDKKIRSRAFHTRSEHGV